MRYVALLRGINVGGSGVISMVALKKHFESLGFKDVTTYIQSGNVLFSSRSTNVAALEKKIEGKLAAIFAREPKAFVLTATDLKAAAAGNTLGPEKIAATHQCQLMFLSTSPAPANVKALMARRVEPLRFHVRRRVFYYAYPRGYPGPRPPLNFEKILGVRGTTRNWKVVDKLIELLAAGT
jgi:uncharacterized protein (DUF1697 family)